ncbi:MAG: ArnT family glycosyltransferase, partial [Candidatus Binatia bacterium]
MLALGVRVWAIDFGLPDSYHKDEIAIVRRALAFGTGDLNPHSFHWPAFHLYVLFGLYGAVYLIGAAAGFFESVADYRNLYFSDPTLFYLAGRLLSALLGTATVYVTYRAASRLDDRRAAIFAALCLALTYYHVRDSHLATLDVPMTFWASLAFYAAVKVLTEREVSPRWYVAGGIASALATATKYNGGIVFLALATAHVLRRPALPHRHLVAAALIACAAFFVATPYNLLDWNTFMRDFAFQRQHIAEGGAGLATEPWRYYGYLLTFVRLKNARLSLFDPMALLFAAGVVTALFGLRRGEAAVTVVVPIAYLAYISRWEMAATRYLDPIFPMLSILAGSVLSRMRGPGLAVAAAALFLSLRSAVVSDLVLS